MTSYLTIDAGFVVKLILPTAVQQQYLKQMASWQASGYQLCAPMLWAYEVTSVFSKLVHFGQLTTATGRESIQLAFELEVQLFPTDLVQSQKAFAWTRELKRGAAYDGYYLALAQQLESEFWTADKRLVNAVGLPWVKSVEALK